MGLGQAKSSGMAEGWGSWHSSRLPDLPEECGEQMLLMGSGCHGPCSLQDVPLLSAGSEVAPMAHTVVSYSRITMGLEDGSDECLFLGASPPPIQPSPSPAAMQHGP